MKYMQICHVVCILNRLVQSKKKIQKKIEFVETSNLNYKIQYHKGFIVAIKFKFVETFEGNTIFPPIK